MKSHELSDTDLKEIQKTSSPAHLLPDEHWMCCICQKYKNPILPFIGGQNACPECQEAAIVVLRKLVQ